jgi:predicted AlkP superfamily phosphohydrolase/phosphomutase
LNYYKRIDNFIGDVFERFRKDFSSDNFFMLSDHGFCQTKNEVFVNSVLAKENFLQLSSPEGRTLESLSDKTRAFALDPARIYIRHKNRFSDGCVAPDDVGPIKRDLKELFLSLEHNGDKVVQEVFDAADVYSGPEAENGPDLLIVPTNGYDMKGRIGSPDIVGERRLQGMHTWNDAFFFTLRKDLLEEEGEIHLLHTPQKILRSLDVS